MQNHPYSKFMLAAAAAALLCLPARASTETPADAVSDPGPGVEEHALPDSDLFALPPEPAEAAPEPEPEYEMPDDEEFEAGMEDQDEKKSSGARKLKESMADFMQVIDLFEDIVTKKEKEEKNDDYEISIPQLSKFPKAERKGLKKTLAKASEAAQKTCRENENCLNARIHEVKIVKGDPKTVEEGEALEAEVTVYVVTRMPARLVKTQKGWELK